MFSRIPFDRVNWTNSAFLIGTSLITLIGLPMYFIAYGLSGINAAQLGMLFFYLVATGLSITLGYHRLFSHLAFKAKWPVRLFTLVFGACAFENTVVNWASDHRKHHKHVDHDDDPYDITKGFFWAHMGWIMFKLNPEPPIDNVKDLQKDPLVRWQYKWYVPIALLVGLALPALIGYFADPVNPVRGALGGFMLAGMLRIIFVQHCTFFINSLCHTVGRQPYSDKCSARDSHLMAFFTYGEGYHNFHHEFQHDYRNGIKAWHWDPTKWSILILQKLGLVSDLRTVPDAKILRAEMQQAQKQAAARVAKLQEQANCAESAGVLEQLQPLIDKLNENLAAVEQALKDRVEISKISIAEWRKETHEFLAQLRRSPLPA